jgi:hypothetical protein
MSERQSVPAKYIYVGLVISLVLAVCFSLFVYVKYIRYEARALRHIEPQQYVVAASVAVEQAVVYEPFRRHILTVFEAHRKAKESRALHLERKTGLELGVDTREIAFGLRPDGKVAIAVGGLFRRERFVSGVAQLLNDEGFVAEVVGNPPRVRGPRGATVGVARDGVLVVGADDAAYASAQSESGAWPAPAAGTPVLAVHSGRLFQPGSYGLKGVTDFSLTISVVGAEAMPFEARLEFGASEPKTAAELLAAVAPVQPKNVMLRAVSAGRYEATARLSREEFDRAVAKFGGALAEGLGIP